MTPPDYCRPNPLVYVLFLVSGAAGLVAEVSWSRQVGLVVGNTAPAIALVLASYFLGLAVGQLLGAQLARRGNPLLWYGIAELAVAAWSGLVPSLLDLVGTGQGPGWLSWEARTAIDGAWCFLILLPATAALGATFPLVAAHLSPINPAGARRVTAAYALNTLGGLVGVVAATAILLVVVGVRGSGYLSAGVAAACGLAACVVSTGPRPTPAVVASRDTTSDLIGSWPQCLAGLSGFAAIALEVLYARLFAVVFHNSTYTFGAVLGVFLAGLATGSAIVATVGRRVSPGGLAAAASASGAIAVAASVVVFVRLTRLEYHAAGDSFAGYLGSAFGLVAVIVLPPVTILGMLLPCAFAAAESGQASGRLVALNSVAGAAGAMGVSLILLPWLGLWGTFGFTAGVCGLPALAWSLRRDRRLLACGLAAALTVGVSLTASAPRQATPRHAEHGEEIVRRWESAHGWIDVVRSPSDGSLQVRENLHYRHGSTGNAARERRLGRLPLLLHSAPKEVAFLGLGTGLTASPVVADGDVERAVVVELIPEVVEAARLLGNANDGVVDHPKVEVRVDDARHFLRRTGRRFDVVVSDLFVPWESRAGYLYTVEHYTAVRRRLKPGGLFCQWVALYQVGPSDLELIADSFAAVFPVTTLWWGQLDEQRAMVALVGSDAPIDFEGERLSRRWKAAGVGGSEPDAVLGSPNDWPGLFIGNWPYRPTARRNTDERPRLEFAAPVSHRDRVTLRGDRLGAYFDEVLSRLDVTGVRFGDLYEPAAVDRRHVGQRRRLVGESR